MAVNEKELELIVRQILNQMSGTGSRSQRGGKHPQNGSCGNADGS